MACVLPPSVRETMFFSGSDMLLLETKDILLLCLTDGVLQNV
jgi:hypothetical protein